MTEDLKAIADRIVEELRKGEKQWGDENWEFGVIEDGANDGEGTFCFVVPLYEATLNIGWALVIELDGRDCEYALLGVSQKRADIEFLIKTLIKKTN